MGLCFKFLYIYIVYIQDKLVNICKENFTIKTNKYYLYFLCTVSNFKKNLAYKESKVHEGTKMSF